MRYIVHMLFRPVYHFTSLAAFVYSSGDPYSYYLAGCVKTILVQNEHAESYI